MSERVEGFADQWARMGEQVLSSWRDALAPAYNAINGYRVVESELLQRGQVVQTFGEVVMHPADVIRLRHPRGWAGSVAASLEWQQVLIDRGVARALKANEMRALRSERAAELRAELAWCDDEVGSSRWGHVWRYDLASNSWSCGFCEHRVTEAARVVLGSLPGREERP